MPRFILIATLILAGCASPVVYRDPQTGHTAECSSSNIAPFPAAQHDVSDCSAMLEHMGWVRD
jgi:hypothetical protein